MLNIVFVGIGGFIGSISRYVLVSYMQSLTKTVGFPLGTLLVNLIGCAAIGLLSRIDELKNILSPEIRLIVFMGFLGAFTTFSTFGNETIELIQAKRVDLALINIFSQLIMGLSAVIAGRFIANLLWS